MNNAATVPCTVNHLCNMYICYLATLKNPSFFCHPTSINSLSFSLPLPSSIPPTPFSLSPSLPPSPSFPLYLSLPPFLSPSSLGWIEIQWDHGGANSYRMGAEGKFDLTLSDDEPQPTAPQTTPSQTTPPQTSGETSGQDTPPPVSQTTTTSRSI